MKKVVGVLVMATVLLSSCMGPKPAYKTAEGKRKLKYYNEIQFGGKQASTMKKKF